MSERPGEFSVEAVFAAVDKKMLTTTEVGKRLGIDGKTARRYCERGVFPGAYQLIPGGPWRVPEEDVQAAIDKARYVRRRRVGGGA